MKKFFVELIGPIDWTDIIEAAAILGGFMVIMAFMAVVCWFV